MMLPWIKQTNKPKQTKNPQPKPNKTSIEVNDGQADTSIELYFNNFFKTSLLK